MLSEISFEDPASGKNLVVSLVCVFSQDAGEGVAQLGKVRGDGAEAGGPGRPEAGQAEQAARHRRHSV